MWRWNVKRARLATALGLSAVAWASLTWGRRTNDCLEETCRQGLRDDALENGAFTVLPSVDQARYEGDLVVDDRGMPVQKDGKDVYTRVPRTSVGRPAVKEACEGLSGPCVTLRTRAYGFVVFALPPKPGTYALEDLDAQTMEIAGTLRERVRGEIVVRKVARPCGLGACGKLDADVRIPAPETPGDGPVVYGAGRLVYGESPDEQCSRPACVEPDIRIPMGPR
jgi:hypothetical protein